MLGIVIGVSSVIILMAMGAGAQEGIMKQMSSLINNNITIAANGGYTTWTNEDVKGYVKAITLTPELSNELESAFPELSGAVTYGVTTMGQVSNSEGTSSTFTSFAGVPMWYIEKMDFTIDYGRDFNEFDFSSASEVAIINKNVIDSLFNGRNALGEKISVNNKEYTVVGVLEDASIMGMTYIPLDTYWQRVAGNKDITAITVKLDANADNALWQAKIQYFLLRKYNVKHLDLAWFTLSSTAAVGDAIDATMAIFNIFLAAIGGISLLVGGIGVMNIMLVSVTERTREIWIRKAIWALNADIIQQFLIESIVVTLFGGIIAIFFSLWVERLINHLQIQDLTMSVTASVVVTAFTLTLLIGILSGILPAKRAADLKPIDALRFE